MRTDVQELWDVQVTVSKSTSPKNTKEKKATNKKLQNTSPPQPGPKHVDWWAFFGGEWEHREAVRYQFACVRLRYHFKATHPAPS